MSQYQSFFKGKSLSISAVIFLVSFLAYLSALNNGFVYDDNFVVMDNPLIRSGAPLGDIFFNNVWSFFGEGNKANFYRPVQLLLYRAEYALFGLNPMPWHLVSVLLHAVNAVLVFLVASVLLSGAESGVSEGGNGTSSTLFVPPVIAALVFALHPVNVEPAAWVSSVSDLIFTFFFILALYLYITRKSLKSAYSAGYYGALVAFFMALFAKETAMAFIPVIFFYDLSRSGAARSGGRAFNWKAYVPFLLAALFYMFLRTYALGGLIQKETVDMGTLEALINIFPLFFAYLGKLVLPVNLSVIYSLDLAGNITEPGVLTALVVTAAFIALFIYYRKMPAPLIALALIVFPLLPVLYIPVISTGGFAERYLYLPTMGFGLLLGYWFKWGVREISVRHHAAGKTTVRLFTTITTVAVALLLIFYLVGTTSRIGVWKDDFTLWLDALENSPKSAIAHYNLGTLYQGERSYPEAIWHYQNAARLDKSYSAALYNLGSIFADVRRYSDAVVYFEKAARIDPDQSEFAMGLARAYQAGGSPDRAIKVLEAFVESKPGYKEAKRLLKELKSRRSER